MRKNTKILSLTIFGLSALAGLILLADKNYETFEADPVNPDYTVTPELSEKPSLPSKILKEIKEVAGPDEPDVKPDKKEQKESQKTIVNFSGASAKKAFIARNGLQPNDLKQIASNSYVINIPPDELTAVNGAETQENIKYTALLTPNDPLHGLQYFPDNLNLEDAWDVTTGSSNVTVAVIDNGFALSHQDLSSRWYVNPNEFGGGKQSNGLDDDGNGFIDDWRGWDFANGAGDNSPLAGTTDPAHYFVSHGTNTSGLVGSLGNNGVGIAGVNWQSKILPVQALGDNGSGFTSDVTQAVYYAIEMDVDVISMSLGSVSSDAALKTALDLAADNNITVIAAAGNCGDTNFAVQGCSYQGQMLYPGRYSNTVAVGATDYQDDRAAFSSWGDELDITAPGSGSIRTPTWSAGNQTTSYTLTASGTSIATPIVTGVASLIKSENPSYTPDQVKSSLLKYVSKVSGMNCKSFTSRYGFGRVNADNSLVKNQGSQSSDCNATLRQIDFDGDGRGDVLWHRPGGKSDRLWSGTSTSASFNKSSKSVSGDYKVKGGDFNGDGRGDIFWYRPGKAIDRIWYGKSTKGTFDKVAFNIDSTYTPMTGDFNGDGYDDLFLYRPGSAVDRIWYGTATKGVFDKRTINVNSTYKPVTGDFNGDSYSDIFWYRAGTAIDRIWYGTATKGVFDKRTINVNSTYKPVTGDFNGDSYSDIFWYRPGPANDKIWYGTDSKAVFSRYTTSVKGTYKPVSNDFNGDRISDILWYGPGTAKDILWRGKRSKAVFKKYNIHNDMIAKPVK